MPDERQEPIQQRVRSVHNPEAGFFSMLLVKNGPLVAARICHTEAGWWAELYGRPCAPPEDDPFLALYVMDIWLGAKLEISEAEYNRLLGNFKDRRHAASQPKKPINLGKMKPLF